MKKHWSVLVEFSQYIYIYILIYYFRENDNESNF